MIWFDRLSAMTLFVLGCIHNFIAAPTLSETLTTSVLWFVTGGITLWYASFINALWLHRRQDRVAAGVAALSNVVLVAFCVLFVLARGSFTDPQNLALLLPATWLMSQSLAAALADRSPPA